jgi:hypothetical protein
MNGLHRTIAIGVSLHPAIVGARIEPLVLVDVSGDGDFLEKK